MTSKKVAWNKGKTLSDEHRRHLSEARKGQPSWNKGLSMEDLRVKASVERLNNIRRCKVPSPLKGCHLSSETKQRMSIARLGKPSPSRGQRLPEPQRLKMIATKNKPEALETQRERSRKLWEQPDYIHRVHAGLNRRPTAPEEKLIAIFAKHFPELQYNGDFRLGVSIARFIPDFVNVNGRKELVEVFGDYWHSPKVTGGDWRKSELGKILIYNSLGYECLVLWERDLREKPEAEIVSIIEAFTRR